MHSVAPNETPAFLEEFKTRYQNHDNGQYEWDLSRSDHKKLISELAKQFGAPRIPDSVLGEKGRNDERICAYCERACTVRGAGPTKNQIDHFAPRSGFNHLTFEWSNLMYVCRRCNSVKDDGKFVESLSSDENAYVNPRKPGADSLFSFEESPASNLIRIIPNPALNNLQDRVKAEKTIEDLCLNDVSSIRGRNLPLLRWRLVAHWKAVKMRKNRAEFDKLVQRATNRRAEYSSLIIWARDSGYFS